MKALMHSRFWIKRVVLCLRMISPCALFDVLYKRSRLLFALVLIRKTLRPKHIRFHRDRWTSVGPKCTFVPRTVVDAVGKPPSDVGEPGRRRRGQSRRTLDARRVTAVTAPWPRSWCAGRYRVLLEPGRVHAVNNRLSAVAAAHDASPVIIALNPVDLLRLRGFMWVRVWEGRHEREEWERVGKKKRLNIVLSVGSQCSATVNAFRYETKRWFYLRPDAPNVINHIVLLSERHVRGR